MSNDNGNDWRREYRRQVGEVGSEVGWTTGKVFRLVILPLIALGVVLASMSYAFGWCGEAAEVARDTYGPKAYVHKYEWFKDKANSIANYDAQIETAKAALAQFKMDMGETPRNRWSPEDKTEHGRLSTVLQGLRNQRNSVAAEFNAAAQKSTWDFARSDELPQKIDLIP